MKLRNEFLCFFILSFFIIYKSSCLVNTFTFRIVFYDRNVRKTPNKVPSPLWTGFHVNQPNKYLTTLKSALMLKLQIRFTLLGISHSSVLGVSFPWIIFLSYGLSGMIGKSKFADEQRLLNELRSIFNVGHFKEMISKSAWEFEAPNAFTISIEIYGSCIANVFGLS